MRVKFYTPRPKTAPFRARMVVAAWAFRPNGTPGFSPGGFQLSIFLIALIFIPAFFISLAQAGMEEDAAKVKICGKVTGEYNKDGLLYITLNKVINRKEASEVAVVSRIDSSGEYCMEAPMGLGFMNVTVFNPPDAASELIKYKVPFAVYLENPLYINDKDMSGVDIAFKPHGASPVLMENYYGSTVSISGEVFMDDYKEGHIGITVNTDGARGVPGINLVIIEKPGKYSLDVPAGSGELYISAINLQKGGELPQYYSGRYSKNPVLVKDKNIEKIDITIDQVGKIG